MNPIAKKLRDSLLNHRSGALVTIVSAKGSVPREAGSKMLVYADGAIAGSIGGGKMESLVIARALELLKTGQCALEDYELYETGPKSFGAICGGSVTLFIEPLLRPPTLLIAGAGHVGRALARQAALLDMYVVVIDDRPDWASPEQIPWAHEVLVQDIPAAVAAWPLDVQTCIAAVTRAPAIDEEIVFKLQGKPYAYLGMIGSQRKVKIVFENLEQRGVDPAWLQTIYAPLGLELGAESPEEIAVSILAEILGVLKGKTRLHSKGQDNLQHKAEKCQHQV